MPAYVRRLLDAFVTADLREMVGQLEIRHAEDGYASQFTQQTKAWAQVLPIFQTELRAVSDQIPTAKKWTVLLEYPLYRLRKRIDAVLLTETVIVVLEMKVGEDRFCAEDEEQVEEYALDLRDFHAASHTRSILPVLWCTEAASQDVSCVLVENGVARVHRIGSEGLAVMLASIPHPNDPGCLLMGEPWDQAPYRPVPNIIEAATAIFSGHDVRSIARADASNLKDAAARIVELVLTAKQEGRRALLFLTGVPGSGKTLAGLQAVHDAVATGEENQGDIVYLSGNTPLVNVLREALALDDHERRKRRRDRKSLTSIRREVRARIQHINDFLLQALRAPSDAPPHEHAIVFDEAQRAWDAAQGEKKLNRRISEPSLLLELMGRHRDWCACVCLVGGGQEINTGEQGVTGWGYAIRQLPPDIASRWSVYAPPDVIHGGPSTGRLVLGDLPDEVAVHEEPRLQLLVSLRSFRAGVVSDWVDHVLNGDAAQATLTAARLGQYPIVLTRSLEEARRWLQQQGRGKRRYGLVASSGARRLRADGLGQTLNAPEREAIVNWYLKPRGDIRSSYALEVPAIEYTCQGLELDFVGLCWGGDFIHNSRSPEWICRRLSGSAWQIIGDEMSRQFVQNSYRVLLTRAREGFVIWIPPGAPNDGTRNPEELNATADFLRRCGTHVLGDEC
jgi:hypothetical protein